jgi:hypothetical protein
MQVYHDSIQQVCRAPGLQYDLRACSGGKRMGKRTCQIAKGKHNWCGYMIRYAGIFAFTTA